MSFIHYKLITNQSYEKITFDGVSLSVSELKKLVLEKKFRKHSAPSSSSTSAGSMSASSQVSFNKRLLDVDLEVTNADTNEVYKNETDLIPKNSRVQINRVVRNIGPAIAGGTITQTHKQSEHLADLRLKNKQLQQKLKNQDIYSDIDSHLNSNTDTSSPTNILNDLLPNTNGMNHNNYTKMPSPDAALYDDILIENENSSNSIGNFNDEILNPKDEIFLAKRIDLTTKKNVTNEVVQKLPPEELLCPFENKDTKKRHLMNNAIIVPCCGYFICCEECIREKLNKSANIECPHESCLQEITINHRLTPYKPIRNKIAEYLASQSSSTNSTPKTEFPSSLFEKLPIIKIETKTTTKSSIPKQPSPVTETTIKPKMPSINLNPKLNLTINTNTSNSIKINNTCASPAERPTEKLEETKIEPPKSRSRSPVSSSSRSSSATSISSESTRSLISEQTSKSSRTKSRSRSSSKNSVISSASPSENNDRKSRSKSPVSTNSRSSTPSIKDENHTLKSESNKVEENPNDFSSSPSFHSQVVFNNNVQQPPYLINNPSATNMNYMQPNVYPTSTPQMDAQFYNQQNTRQFAPPQLATQTNGPMYNPNLIRFPPPIQPTQPNNFYPQPMNPIIYEQPPPNMYINQANRPMANFNQHSNNPYHSAYPYQTPQSFPQNMNFNNRWNQPLHQNVHSMNIMNHSQMNPMRLPQQNINYMFDPLVNGFNQMNKISNKRRSRSRSARRSSERYKCRRKRSHSKSTTRSRSRSVSSSHHTRTRRYHSRSRSKSRSNSRNRSSRRNNERRNNDKRNSYKSERNRRKSKSRSRSRSRSRENREYKSSNSKNN